MLSICVSCSSFVTFCNNSEQSAHVKNTRDFPRHNCCDYIFMRRLCKLCTVHSHAHSWVLRLLCCLKAHERQIIIFNVQLLLIGGFIETGDWRNQRVKCSQVN